MIEEMANDLKKIKFDLKGCFVPQYVGVYEDITAKELHDLGYRKIPENAVVLTGMETEQQFEDLMVAFDEMGFMPNTTHPFPEEYVETWKQRLIFVFGQLRKETAEKFARLVEFHSVSTRDEEGREIFTISALGLKEILHEEFGIPYDEIAKEITEGKV
jgi:hypothetical protein